jgi:hypothetical protein
MTSVSNLAQFMDTVASSYVFIDNFTIQAIQYRRKCELV